jgi:glycosyltransferase involved in cell wall biosynthesis
MYNGKTVSVILPTYNEKDSIQKVIRDFEALLVVDEIIVVNNNAAPGTSEEEVASTSAREVLEPVQGYGSAIQRGFREAAGDLRHRHLSVRCGPSEDVTAKSPEHL